MVEYLLETRAVLLISLGASRFVVKGTTWEDISVAFVHPVLHVLENGIEVLNALSRQQAQLADHAGHRSDGEGTSREANEDDLVAVDVVGTCERICLSDALQVHGGLVGKTGRRKGKLG